MTDASTEMSSYAEMASEVVSAYVANNHVSMADVPALIRSVHDALSGLGQPAAEPAAAKREPAVSIKKSVTDDYIISLEDGRKLKSMKRYLAGLGMTPAEYRAKWGLPTDYPMVAPAYAKQRSELAKTLGLGRKAEAAPPAAESVQEPEPEPAAPAPAAKRGRKPKAA